MGSPHLLVVEREVAGLVPPQAGGWNKQPKAVQEGRLAVEHPRARMSTCHLPGFPRCVLVTMSILIYSIRTDFPWPSFKACGARRAVRDKGPPPL